MTRHSMEPPITRFIADPNTTIIGSILNLQLLEVNVTTKDHFIK